MVPSTRLTKNTVALPHAGERATRLSLRDAFTATLREVCDQGLPQVADHPPAANRQSGSDGSVAPTNMRSGSMQLAREWLRGEHAINQDDGRFSEATFVSRAVADRNRGAGLWRDDSTNPRRNAQDAVVRVLAHQRWS